MSSEVDEFKTEFLEMLDRAEEALLAFDQLPENEGSKSLYDEVFRAYHNIKGGSGMIDWGELQHHVHQLESVLMQSKDSFSIPKHLINWFLKGHDVARAIMASEPYEFDYNVALAEEETQKEDALMEKAESAAMSNEELTHEFRAEVSESLDRISSALIRLEGENGDKELIDSLYRDIHSLKGAMQLFGLREGSSLTHAMENSLEGVRNNPGMRLDKSHVSTLLLCTDLINQCLDFAGAETTSNEVKFMVQLLAPFSENVIPSPEVKPASEPTNGKNMEEFKNDLKKADDSAPGAAEGDKPDSTIRVQVSLLDRLMSLMGEMVLVRNQVLQYSNKTDDLEFLNLSQKLDVVTSELQEETMKTRMQPIGNILNKFQRVVRDLSASLNKKITLNLIGVETELDKTLIEAVKDPLTHIVRNACDHGIENPERRLKVGKPEKGTITIKAYHEGGQVIVDISDDGKGLSQAKILEKALEKGIVDAGKAERMSEREIFSLIFAPGFSTAEHVTNVSGRGVGMDVVKSNIERIGGLVDLSSKEGEGTNITLKIPLTLAIVPAMIVRSGNDRFAIPQVKLVELVRADEQTIEYVQGRPIYRLRGNILPLISMGEVLGETERKGAGEVINIVVLNSESHLFGLIVDEILDTADIVVKPLARFLKSISIYSGATVLGDGSVAFIMDVLGVAQRHLGSSNQSEEKNLSNKYFCEDENELREFVLVRVASPTKHAVPLSIVRRMEEIPTASIELSGSQRVIRYRGGILKIINLNDVLGYPVEKHDKDITQIIVLKVDEQIFGLEVDQIIDVLSTRDSLDNSIPSHDAIIGNLVTKDEIIVVIDGEKVFELTENRKAASDFMRNPLASLPKILFVEDTESIRTKISESLLNHGYEVETAVDGLDGLRKISEHHEGFDLIISDIEMPNMNGYEFAKKVREIQGLKKTPLIAFTTRNSKEDLIQAKTAGFNTFLEKGKGRLLPLLVSECLNRCKRKTA